MSKPGEAPRIGKELLEATRPFAVESTRRSWWCVGSTLVVLGTCLFGAAVLPGWPLRLVASIVGGFVFVRAFILYHDHMHRALLRRSRVAKSLFSALGLIMLTPPRYWRYSHNFHHGNVGKPLPSDSGPALLVTSDLGSFPLMSTDTWRDAPAGTRLKYRIARHPVTLLGAYLTVFLFSLCLLPVLREPRRYWDGGLSLILHGGLVAALWIFMGFSVLFFSFLLPFTIAAAVGAYLFFAQHNYEGMHLLQPEEWNFYRGATESSSYMKLGRLMHWFTGNIGYHHIHHLNPGIPFYRLPKALAAIPELQGALATTLRPRDILGSLRLNLWDPEHRRLVSYGEARRSA